MSLRESDTVLAVVPQFHAMSWGLPYAGLYCGANLLMPGQFLQAVPLAEMIETYRVTVAAGVPTIWNGLYHELKNNPRDISTIRALVVGAMIICKPPSPSGPVPGGPVTSNGRRRYKAALTT